MLATLFRLCATAAESKKGGRLHEGRRLCCCLVHGLQGRAWMRRAIPSAAGGGGVHSCLLPATSRLPATMVRPTASVLASLALLWLASLAPAGAAFLALNAVGVIHG